MAGTIDIRELNEKFERQSAFGRSFFIDGSATFWYNNKVKTKEALHEDHCTDPVGRTETKT